MLISKVGNVISSWRRKELELSIPSCSVARFRQLTYGRRVDQDEGRHLTLEVCRHGRADLLAALCHIGAIYARSTDSEGCNGLHLLARSVTSLQKDRVLERHKYIVSTMLRHGATINAEDVKGNTMLHYVADHCDIGPQAEFFSWLVKSMGANPHARNQRGQTPLDRLEAHLGDWWELGKKQAAEELLSEFYSPSMA